MTLTRDQDALRKRRTRGSKMTGPVRRAPPRTGLTHLARQRGIAESTVRWRRDNKMQSGEQLFRRPT